MEFTRVFPEIMLIEDTSLRKKVEQTWLLAGERGGWKLDDLGKIPFTLLIPDTRISIIKHTQGVTGCAMKVAESLRVSYADMAINDAFLVAGALLHDVGKLLEYERSAQGYCTSRHGKLLRHPVSGAGLAAECRIPAEVLHIIYTHSKEGDRYERSIESIIVHHCDFLNFEPLKVMAHE